VAMVLVRHLLHSYRNSDLYGEARIVSEESKGS